MSAFVLSLLSSMASVSASCSRPVAAGDQCWTQSKQSGWRPRWRLTKTNGPRDVAQQRAGLDPGLLHAEQLAGQPR